MKIPKIYSIKPQFNKITKQPIKKQNIQEMPQNPYIGIFPYFLGGYSLDLAKTAENIEKEKFPPDIFEAVQSVLKTNNPENKTLYNIHFEKYKGILDCYSLDELKEKYPEFKDVISVYDVDYKTGNFIDEFLNGNSEVFSIDEDLTLQLIKLYWGQGFSLGDLSKYISSNSSNKKGFYLLYTMKNKLNIPLMNNHYAQILKFSNKQYNKDLSERMSIKIKEAYEAKKQKLEGEPFVIPRGPLSEAHKKHISEGLKKYFKEHPEAVYKLTKRQEEFYKNNPEYKDKLSEVMLYSWNKTQEGQSVKRNLNKFMRKYGGLSEEELCLKTKINKEKMTALEAFWLKNPWAKEKFSIAVKKGWEYFKNLESDICFNAKNNENYIFIDILPNQISKNISVWAKENGILVDDFIYYGRIANKNYTPYDDETFQQYQQKIEEIIFQYGIEHSKELNICISALQFTLISFKNDLENQSEELPIFIKNNPDILNKFKKILSSILSEKPVYEKIEGYGNVPIENINYSDLSECFYKLIKALPKIDKNAHKITEYLNHKINKIYNFLIDGNQYEINKIITA